MGDRVLVDVYALVAAGALLLQGIHVLRRGDFMPFFFEQRRARSGSSASLPPAHRFQLGLLCILPSVAIFAILGSAFFRNMHSVMAWLADHILELIGGIFLVIFVLIAFARPDIVLRWALKTYPDQVDEIHPSFAHPLIRVLAVLFLLGAVVLLEGM